MRVIQSTTDCRDWAFLQYVEVRTTPFLKLGNQNKKPKIHNFVIGTGSFRRSVSYFFVFVISQMSQSLRCRSSQSGVYGLSGGQYGWAVWCRYIKLVELFGGVKKLKIETVRSGWNFQISWPKTRAIRNRKKIFFSVCDLFYLFFRGHFYFRYNSNIWRVKSFKISYWIVHDRTVTRVYFASTTLVKCEKYGTSKIWKNPKWSLRNFFKKNENFKHSFSIVVTFFRSS